MGLLDDAIREHLELQRRRGADPAEIERSEREALGPVRRAPEELEQDEFDPHAGGDEAEEYEYKDDFEHEGAYTEDSALEPHETDSLYDTEPAEYEPGPTVHEPEPAYENERQPHDDGPPPNDEEPTAHHEPAAYPDPPMPHAAPEGGHPGQETVEYELEDHPEADRGPEHPEHAEPKEREDVLEETPEFLQDTPEHDRLWFEQRPPRDFDFDG
jgi:hypothetical protein